ncbi:hypothetical protein F5144DRAFT_347207 [Chaetomium tenue]|uniref:Uncharacterized protein n=1 Tax=Chaetomium tenue TaxID=1854479 RepID=A0ACB7NXX8_9PEZI|nr:hypothetical protein F5144DRAFT_347207 [Chaetomium globosum]
MHLLGGCTLLISTIAHQPRQCAPVPPKPSGWSTSLSINPHHISQSQKITTVHNWLIVPHRFLLLPISAAPSSTYYIPSTITRLFYFFFFFSFFLPYPYICTLRRHSQLHSEGLFQPEPRHYDTY